MPSEFELIRRHFTRPTDHTDLAVGDDAALIRVGPGMQLSVSCDMLVSGTHFFADADPGSLGWKALAVNLSDLAAMGARPRWAVLALALPAVDEAWIRAFAEGLHACATRFGVDLVGGDTTRGPLNLCVTVMGEVPAGSAITRAGARSGNDLWITGAPGRAALGLACLRDALMLPSGGRAVCVDALHRPMPRVDIGQRLRGVASAMLDVSDGLLGDLGHILECSGVGATVDVARLPLTPLLDCGADRVPALDALLSGGDDYELLFTAAPTQRPRIEALSAETMLPITRIGSIGAEAGKLMLRTADGRLSRPSRLGYDHFRDHATDI